MADDVPSQARFIGGLALVLGAFAVLAALLVLFAAMNPPQL
jgi:hypothetical protein